jgi:hypothetical protein
VINADSINSILFSLGDSTFAATKLKRGGFSMRTQRIYNFRLLIAIILTLCLSMAVGFTNGAVAAAPGKATLVSPMGLVYDDTPTYTWNAVSDSTQYYLWVDDSTGTPIKKWYTATESGCGDGSGLCSITPNTALALGSGEWWVQTWNNDGYGPWSDSVSFTVEEGFDQASINGTYSFTAMEQGGAPAPSSDSVVQEAAMGIVSADGKGSMAGKISWNMYDFPGLVPNSDRFVLHRFPITGSYTLEADGFGTMTSSIDLDQDGDIDMQISGKLVVTKTKDKAAIEFWFIGDEPPPGGGSIVIIHFFKREQ